jgi:hypothetical protein
MIHPAGREEASLDGKTRSGTDARCQRKLCDQGLWCKRRKRGIFATNLLLRTRSGALNMDDLFKGRHFDREIIILCVRWYLRFKHSFRDLVEMMAKRGISLAHTTIMRWIRRCVRNSKGAGTHFACRAGASWRVDETYVKIKGRWTYVYRAVDKEGKTVDFLLQAKRDVAASKAFFRRAFKSQGRLPRAITGLRIGRRGNSSKRIMVASGPQFGPRNT